MRVGGEAQRVGGEAQRVEPRPGGLRAGCGLRETGQIRGLGERCEQWGLAANGFPAF